MSLAAGRGKATGTDTATVSGTDTATVLGTDTGADMAFARAPWLADWRLLEPDLGLSLDALGRVDPVERLFRLNRVAQTRGLCLRAGQRLRFVAQTETLGMPYERAVALQAAIPTRVAGPGARHDLLNALAWLLFPRTKAVLHDLQATVIARDGVGAVRGPLRDGVTLLDENGIFLVVQDMADAASLQERAWHRLLVDGRARWGAQICAVPIGHGLVERLVQPFPALTAHVRPLRLPAPWFGLPAPERLRRLDRAAAARLRVRPPLPGTLYPLPVLGVPGWWAANLDPGFYRDTRVFRPQRA